MKHLEPLPKTKSSLQVNRIKSPRPSAVKLLLAGVLLVAGMGYSMTKLWNSAVSDNLSDAGKAALVAEFAHLKAVNVEPVTLEDAEKALDTMQLAPDQRQQLQNTVLLKASKLLGANKTGGDSTKLVWITVWDFDSPDGDVVHISSAGYETDVTLRKVQTRIAVPLDVSRIVKITGVHDGGGGITLGVKSGASPISLPVIQVGQILDLPVAF